MPQDIRHVFVIGSDGKIVWQYTCLSTPERISGEYLELDATYVAPTECHIGDMRHTAQQRR